MTNFIATKLRGTPKNKKNRRGKKSRRRERVLSMEALQSRELMAADFSWLGDTLQVRGTDGNDFIAVQNDVTGTRVFAGDTIQSELEGRPFAEASRIKVAGGDGDDVLFSYQSEIPVSLFGESGNDFLFSDQATAAMDGGEGLDWIYDSQLEGVWEDALGVEGFDLDLSDLDAVPQFDSNDRISLQVELDGRTEIAGQLIDVSGAVEVSESGVNVHVAGSVDSWSDAFGVAGLELKDTQIVLDTSSDELAGDAYRVHVDSHLDTDGTLIGIAGTVDLAPETVDASFTGSIENWGDAFGIDDLDLQQAELSISGSVDEQSDSEFSIEIGADMLIDSTLVAVAGVLHISPERIDAQLSGSVENWANAFGIEQLSLSNAHLNVVASTDRKEDHRVAVGIQADMRVENTDVEVAGSVEITPDNIDVVMTGNVPHWDDAFGFDDLDLEDANLTVLASTDREGSQELYVDVDADMDLFGTYVGIGGMIQLTPNGVSTNLSGTVAGDWAGAFGIDALQLRDTELSIAHDPTDGDESGFNIELDTDLELFGSYVDVVGNLDFSLSGVSVSLSPPGELELENLLGISGFSLSSADVTLDAGTDGMSLSLDATMDMGSVDVDFEGLFSISQDEVSASLTGSIDRWDDAFDVSGLNLEDVVMTVGAEKSAAGASMFIGLGAGISIGAKEIEVAGLVGVGTTGWEVAFRGSIDVLASTDLVVFANTMTRAGDPDAKPIPSDALGDFEMQDAYINFAPYGGNEALGITDGFGIGGEFYKDGELLAAGEFVVDLETLSFEVGLNIPEIELGPVDLSDVIVDIRIATGDSYFRVAGSAEMMGAEVSLEGMIQSDGDFSLTGTANVDVAGLDASVTFTVDNSGMQFEAIVQGTLFNNVTNAVTGEMLEAAQSVQTKIDNAQAVVATAKSNVDKLNTELAEAKAEAQKEIDEIQSKLDSAKSIVDSARASKDYWYRVRKSRYNAWRSAQAATKRAAWYNYASYKAKEVAKYASYKYAATVYSAKVVTYHATSATYNTIRNSAGWVLDNVGVEANPEVLRIKALLAAGNLAVNSAEAILNGIEDANAHVLRGLEIANSLEVNHVLLSGNVSNYVSAGVHAEIDFSFNGYNQTIGLSLNTDRLVQDLTKKLAGSALGF
ncbi:coiled-coil domain-containing protein [Rhodopirellula bahusiensis]|uniref:Uncharacterized protein n=1 Tax=Rhodopirellula bahusiensis TaxID=2014065 RepID=A0A2G1WDD8_9BACT|nr:hypothetical protein [Rhodopirellula bahusiensis]PHQ37074.1 hypothetical protein CEE69_01540 [Rhodopirellula bahusiensis]